MEMKDSSKSLIVMVTSVRIDQLCCCCMRARRTQLCLELSITGHHFVRSVHSTCSVHCCQGIDSWVASGRSFTRYSTERHGCWAAIYFCACFCPWRPQWNRVHSWNAVMIMIIRSEWVWASVCVCVCVLVFNKKKKFRKLKKWKLKGNIFVQL